MNKILSYGGIGIAALSIIGGLTTVQGQQQNNKHYYSRSSTVVKLPVSNSKSTTKDNTINYGSISDSKPTQSLSTSVVSTNVKKQLKYNIAYNNNGAFTVNNNKNDLNAKISSAPYVSLAKTDNLGRAGQARAYINKSSAQYQKRNLTGNNKTIKPVGWNQFKIGGRYQYLYNRGHLIGYAIAGNVKGFDASEANKQNIITQTSWSNQASSSNSTGQNYYEKFVRTAIGQGKQVVYRVTPIYDGNNLIASGTQLEAKSRDNSLEFNVFVPNVQPGIKLDLKNGFGQILK